MEGYRARVETLRYAQIMIPTMRSAIWLSALALTGIANATSFSIKRVAKAGSETKYSMSVEFKANGSNGTVSATVLEKITNVDKDGNFSVEQSQLDAKGTFASEDISVPARPPITMTYQPNGLVTAIQGELTDMRSYRVENLSAVVDPGKSIDVDDSWTAEIKEDKATGTPAVRAEYTLVAEEKIGDVDTLKIKGNAKELSGDLPASTDFTIWISKSDGAMVKLQSKWINAPFPGISSPIEATVKITKIAL